MMKKWLLSAVFIAAAMTSAYPQAGQFPAGYVQGNPTAQAGQGTPSSPSSIFDRAFGSVRGSILERGSSGWGAIAPSVTAGLPWVGNGTGVDPSYQMLGIVGGGTNCSAASGACLDNITGFASTGLINRTGTGTYAFVGLPLSTTNGGTNCATASGTCLDNITGFASTGLLNRTGAGTYAFVTPPSSTIVGISDTQTLTNKTFNCANNTCTVRLGSDVTGTLPFASMPTGTSDTVLGYWGSTIIGATAVPNCTGSLTYSTSTHTYGCNTGAGTGTVTTSGTPAAPQLAQFTASTVIKGVSFSTKTTNVSSSSSYTPTTGAVNVKFECVGGGGGGGGVAGASTFFLGAGGGGAGSYSNVTTTPAAASGLVITVGSAGSGGAAGFNSGGAGGVTSVGTICVANGGSGGGGVSSGSAAQVGGTGGSAGTGDVAFGGSAGHPGIYSSGGTLVVSSGNGAAGPYGGAGLGAVQSAGSSAGGNATGCGSGGAGAVSNTSASNAAGGNASKGCVIITETIIN